jgi:hypothetical protein
VSKKNNKIIASKVVAHLIDWGAYFYHKAKTGSVYIKFPHWGLGSIRVADHNGKGKYTYRWRVRTDKTGHIKRGVHRGVEFLEVSPDMMDHLVDEFESSAEKRGVRTGDEEVWGV